MTKAKVLEEERQWDEYWTGRKTKSQAIYRLVAGFYREFIIKRSLNYFIEKEFEKGSKLLHAGSGTGQVDTDILDEYRITALDISGEALKLYRQNNQGKAKLLKASIFDIPTKDSFFDGIYNMGVMEHFTEGENIKILREFARVLKSDGKILLFWPPKFGISVIFLNSLHFVLNNILKRNIRLHPEEISLISSKNQVRDILKRGGFKLAKFSFGPTDLFTHCVIIAKKSSLL